MGVGMYLFVSRFCRTSLQQGLKPQRFFVTLKFIIGVSMNQKHHE